MRVAVVAFLVIAAAGYGNAYCLYLTGRLRSVRMAAGAEDKLNLSFKRPQSANAPGNLYVDESCIDCDVCRWMCPKVYGRKGLKSIVQAQPTNENDKLAAFSAMVACPVGAIRTRTPDPFIKEALDVFPVEIDPESMPGVCHAGYHASASFGATPYFLKRAQGNVLIDSPRFNSRLADTIDAEGGLALMILTHRDDVADHAKWKQRFPAMQRVIHRLDVEEDTTDCEVQLDSFEQTQLAPDIAIIHVPGHTAGSICVLYAPSHAAAAEGLALDQGRPASVLFTGDHLAYSAANQALTGFRAYNHGSVAAQAESLQLLTSEDLQFDWVLPGHGRMFRFASQDERRRLIAQAAEAFLRDERDYGGLAGLGFL